MHQIPTVWVPSDQAHRAHERGTRQGLGSTFLTVGDPVWQGASCRREAAQRHPGEQGGSCKGQAQGVWSGEMLTEEDPAPSGLPPEAVGAPAPQL